MLFKVTGMTCGHCARAVTRALQALDPQASVEVDLGKGEVLANGTFAAADAIAAIESEGYAAELLQA